MFDLVHDASKNPWSIENKCIVYVLLPAVKVTYWSKGNLKSLAHQV